MQNFIENFWLVLGKATCELWENVAILVAAGFCELTPCSFADQEQCFEGTVFLHRDRESIADIATRYEPNDAGFEPRCGQEIFYSPYSGVRTGSGPTPSPVQWLPKLSLCGKASEARHPT